MEETGSQPIPPQLTGNIGEQATPTAYPDIIVVEYASYMMVPSLVETRYHGLSQNYTNETIRVQS